MKHHPFSRLLVVAVLVLLPVFAATLRAQGPVMITGTVADSVTGEGLPFAQLLVRGSTTGTVSNAEGQFVLAIPREIRADTLLVSYMGYRTARIPLPAMLQPPVRFVLSPVSLQMAEVEIVALTPETVIRKAVAAIPANYGTDSLVLTAFVRSQKSVGGKLAEFTEAIIRDLKTGYTPYTAREEQKRNRTTNLTSLVKGRVVSDTALVNFLGDVGRNAGCLGCNFIHDFAEFYRNTVLDETLFRYYDFRLEEIADPTGGKIYHIRFDQKKGVRQKLWKGDIYIQAGDFAILQVTQKPSFEGFGEFEKQKEKKQYRIGGIDGWIGEMPRMEWTTTYNRRNGSYYLATIRVQNWVTFTHPVRAKQVKFWHLNEVVVTDASRDSTTVRNFRGDRYSGVDQRWDQVVGKADGQFWAGFNYLPVEKQLQESLEKMESRGTGNRQ